ncbi:PaaX family transcriptional regulator C-terminal domain-containing protein [Streptomyces sp. NPDC096311]|uniref:PaaX family transcriptional regulator n=1 Tax=Streptomyces sp. NPDC096311 TaxID=3366083 RepID=UPI0038107065
MPDIKPRALIIDLLGDYVRHRGSEIRLKALVALGGEFGIAGPAMRVMVGRMREEGWLTVRREGRESIYGLTVKCLRTLDEGRRRIFRQGPPSWTGSWSMVIYTVPEGDRPTREQLRKDLSWLGFGPLAPATWVSPHPRLDDVANIGAALPNARLDLLSMAAPDLATDRSIAARCWDLETLNRDYEAFIRDLRQTIPEYRLGHIDPTTAFISRIRLVHAYRQFPYRDPDLPRELQPAGWLGDNARALFNEAHELLEEKAWTHYEAVVSAIE